MGYHTYGVSMILAETTMLGQLGARMKMMSGAPNLCSHHRFAGPSLALREGDHTRGGY